LASSWMYAALNAARRRVYRKARSALAACLLKCRVESFRPSSTNGSCCQRRCQDDAMGMMVGGFFAAAAAAASSRSQIDVKPRTQHVKYFISTLIHISSLSALRLALCTRRRRQLFLSRKISSPAARSTQSTDVSHEKTFLCRCCKEAAGGDEEIL
jgi:hypothetical protein